MQGGKVVVEAQVATPITVNKWDLYNVRHVLEEAVIEVNTV